MIMQECRTQQQPNNTIAGFVELYERKQVCGAQCERTGSETL